MENNSIMILVYLKRHRGLIDLQDLPGVNELVMHIVIQLAVVSV